jgi:beta-phosphoglucomutase-like phosphatase (HAD superfamily)
MNRYKAVIFDLDGVITDTAHYHYLAWKRLADSLGLPFDEAFNEGLKGIDRMGSLELILARSARSFTQDEKLALAEAKNRHYVELIATMTPADLLPGALAALDSVRAAGLKTGLAPSPCWTSSASATASTRSWTLPASPTASRTRRSS